MFKIKQITSLLAVVAVLFGFATESFAAKKSKTLKNTIKQGFVKCGVSQGLPGFSNVKINLIDINKYFFTIIIFILSLSILIILLTLFNIKFDAAFKLGILTLMNTVNSSLYGLENINFSELSINLKYILIIFMIIGRIEFISVLILIKKFVFKN